MALLENWQPLNLPRGSVRTIVLFVLLGSLWAQMLSDQSMSFLYAVLVLVVLGHYLGAAPIPGAPASAERPPIYVPRVLLHALILAGFAAVGFLLWRDGRLRLTFEDANATILAVVGGLFLGRIFHRAANLVSRAESNRARRWYENAKALGVLAAALLLAIWSVSGAEQLEAEWLQLGLVVAIVFYFGSR
jgi:hypothetical protein